jgi:GDP-4-dehydro-6-deoxy-D-mannose reductase
MVSLITGAAGMMGSHLFELLQERGEDVIATYHNPTLDSRDPILQRMQEHLDLLDQDRVRKILNKYRPSVVFHLAAQSRPDVSFAQPRATLDANVYGTLNLLEACRDLPEPPLVINASSSAVYGDIDWSVPPDENVACNPLSPYGTSKLAQEHLLRNFQQMHGIRYVSARIFNCTGPRKMNDFVSDVCRRVVNDERPIRCGNLTGRRSIVDVRDLVDGLTLCRNIENTTINLGTDAVYLVADVFKAIVGDAESCLDESLLRPTDEPIIYGNIDKAKRLLHWRPKIGLQQTIADILDYWRKL